MDAPFCRHALRVIIITITVNNKNNKNKNSNNNKTKNTLHTLTGEVVRVVVRVEAVLDVVVHLVVGPNSALVPIRVLTIVHACI